MKRNPKDIFFDGIQFILFVVYLFRISKFDFEVTHWLQLIGIFLSIAGIIISLASIFILNKNLSPFPTPKQSATLIKGFTNTFVTLFIREFYFSPLAFQCILKTLYAF